MTALLRMATGLAGSCAFRFRSPSSVRCFFGLILVVLLAGGCATPQSTLIEAARKGKDAERLAVALTSLSSVVDSEEATRLGEQLVQESQRLAAEYKIVGDPLIHNVMVNSGLRKRGLCYHYVNDLMAVLEPEPYRTVEFVRAGSKIGTYREHNTLVVKPAGESFENGLVIDPWRNQGRLFWVRVTGDNHEWVPLQLNTGS